MNKVRWIKVSDELPEFNKEVWIAGEMKYDFEEEPERFVDVGWMGYKYEQNTYNDWYEGQQYFKITHWAHLDEPKHPLADYDTDNE